ncbi:hypothetical protein HY989_01090 [Candidatus Micrarchaeota archaeon]|nr:hypothetical protein [Candidatus Micrarchaeota archaeon]
MKQDGRSRRVKFIDEKIHAEFLKLKEGNFLENQLAISIEKAIEELKSDEASGIHIPRKYWPKEYVQKYGITNLWKYDLPNAWRLIYTLTGNNLEVVSIILEWFDHKAYSKRFRYKVG